MKVILGLLLGFLIGVGCRVANVPLPAPPVLVGALLVLAMTIGYSVIDRLVPLRQAQHKKNCGGPNGL